jgi:hypothetical protein
MRIRQTHLGERPGPRRQRRQRKAAASASPCQCCLSPSRDASLSTCLPRL